MDNSSWNVVVTVHKEGFKEARRSLRRLGLVRQTPFFNVLTMRVQDRDEFLRDLSDRVRRQPHLRASLSRVIPVSDRFSFISRHEFEHKGKKIVDQWLPQLSGQSFHVRMHRRGYSGTLSSLEQEKMFDRYVLGALHSQGQSARIDFSDPDYIIDIETVESEAGFSIWSRSDRTSFPFLNLD